MSGKHVVDDETQGMSGTRTREWKIATESLSPQSVVEFESDIRDGETSEASWETRLL